MFKNYIFDLYGTLVDINTDEWSDDLWEKMALFKVIKVLNTKAKNFTKNIIVFVRKKRQESRLFILNTKTMLTLRLKKFSRNFST